MTSFTWPLVVCEADDFAVPVDAGAATTFDAAKTASSSAVNHGKRSSNPRNSSIDCSCALVH